MGYYTKFTLTWSRVESLNPAPTCSHKEAKGNKFCPVCGVAVGTIPPSKMISEYIEKNKDAFYAIDEYGESQDTAKWYDHEDSMKALSKAFPSVLFTLNGEGEESGDLWNKYFLNGKMQVAKGVIQFDKFDETKLK